LNTVQASQVIGAVHNWMRNSFIAPKDIVKKSTLAEQSLVYLPFWVVSGEATSHYKGILERISPATEQEGDIANTYDWLVLARKQTDFPTRAYHLSLTGKIPFEATKIESGAKTLNSEMTADDAINEARSEIENLHEQLAKDKVDRILDMKTELKVSEAVYLHASVWFINYMYRNRKYPVLLDGSSGEVIKGDLPSQDFNLL
jgi:hypothetical protein